MTDQYFDWLLNFLALAVVVVIVLPLWPWPFDYWPGGAIGGLSMFLWIGMIAMDWIERKTGYYWSAKLAAIVLLMMFAALAKA